MHELSYDLTLLLSSVCFAILVFTYVSTKQASIFNPITLYLIFHFIVFVLRPYFQYYGEYSSIYETYQFYPSLDVKIQTIIVANIGLISFCMSAYLCGCKYPLKFKNPNGPTSKNEYLALFIAFLLCIPVIVLSFQGELAFQGDSDSPVGMELDPATHKPISASGIGYLRELNVLLGPFSVLIAWVYKYRTVSLIPLVSYFLLRSFVGGGRWTFIVAFASLGLLYLYDSKQKWISFRVMLTAGFLFMAFSAIGENRLLFKEWWTGQSFSRDVVSTRKGYFDHMDFANLEYLEYIISVVPHQTKTYDYYRSIQDVLSAPIPRILWPSKPIEGPKNYNLFDYGFPIGMTVSLPGQGWEDLGYLGVIIWCAFGGAFWARLYIWFVQCQQNKFQIALYCILLPLSVQWFRDGVLLSLFKFPFFTALPIILWFVTALYLRSILKIGLPPNISSIRKNHEI